jgi:signal transduction histidine kinase
MAEPERAKTPQKHLLPRPAQVEAEPLDPIIVSARRGAFRAFRVVGTLTGLIALVSVLPGVARGAPTGAGISVVVFLALAFGVVSWLVPVRRSDLTAGFLLVAVGLIAVVGTYGIGPSFTMGSLFVLVPLLATLFYGRRIIIPGAVVTALVLAGVGLVSWLTGHTTVGDIPGASVPFPVYARLCITTLGSVLMALAFVDAVLRAMEASIAKARAAAELAALEHERRLAAELELSRAKRLEEIGQLASGVAHDTKNALLVLSAGVDELKATVVGAEEQAVLADLQHAVAGIGSTVQQLLSLARRQASAARPVALGAQITQFASALKRVLPPSIELRVECPSAAQAVLDPGRLEQALLNLALNARDAMPQGGRLTLRLTDGDDGRVVLEVEDSGTGMDEATAARMFEPFFTTKGEGAGTGLGLHMVRAFVEAAGGAIEVDSAVGRGTRIRLGFPAARTAGVATA